MRQDQPKRRLSTPLPVFLTEDSTTTGPCQKLSLYFFNDKTKNRHGCVWLEARPLGTLSLCPCTQPYGLFLPCLRPGQICACPRAMGQAVGGLSLFLLFQALLPWDEPLPWGRGGWRLDKCHNRWVGEAI